MLKTLLTGAVLGFALLLSPLSSSAEPLPPNEPTAEQPHINHRGGDHARRHEPRRHEHRHHHHHHHHYHHHYHHG
ncbi:hypothetical protein CCR94_15310 [Rhodoblastus sphagnicola]|uniref:Uncharacterized protein n=1 Tax=Rhodoblastus sphagnicola TaxID=333368 RepID=A0A2S6N4C1_9HYPH|nr:hypothetical protein CCR94_15310 [Rhodoblastus sphagnicola]